MEPQIVGMLALLTTTMTAMRPTIEALWRAGLPDSVSVMVAGAPPSQRYGVEIGADGYVPDAPSVVHLAKALVDQS